jgi:hypothetical protein
MTRALSLRVPQKLALISALHLGLGLVLWALSGGWSEVFGYYFTYAGGAYLVSFAFLEFAFARRVRRAFQTGEDLHRAWTLIMVGAACRWVGVILAHAMPSSEPIRNIGLFISGPVQLATLAWALTIVLRLYRRLGYSMRFSSLDWLQLIVCSALAVSGVIQNLITPSSGFFTDILLCVLLFQAIVLKRSVSQMGGGLVAACWTSYVWAVFLTALGDLGITIVAYNAVPVEFFPATWLIWYPAAAAWALGPAFLSEAVVLANESACQRYPAACNSNSSA